jgi:hypothetical protein
MILGREPSDIAAVPDQQSGHDRSHAVDLSDGGAAGRHRHLDTRFGCGELGVEATDVAEEILCQRLAFGLDLADSTDGAQQVSGAGS